MKFIIFAICEITYVDLFMVLLKADKKTSNLYEGAIYIYGQIWLSYSENKKYFRHTFQAQ